jgi:NAD(P)-dependent dehydrogenase (short-subunit alcohol dehydrogenase family)
VECIWKINGTGKNRKRKPVDNGDTIMTMQGKICLITGDTNGIGKATALALSQKGGTVVIVGRNAQRTSQSVEEIRTASGNNKVDALLADLSSQQEVRRLAIVFKSRYSHLASSPAVQGVSGKYFFNSRVVPAAPQATDMVLARKLWEASDKMVHLATDLPAVQLAAVLAGEKAVPRI